jgi:hypothetical protein
MGTFVGANTLRQEPEKQLGRAAKFIGQERRADTRHNIDCPVLVVPLTGSTKIPGHLVDISMGGCRLETTGRVMVTIMMRVELQFELRGIAFRIVGVCQGTRGGNFYAVRFQEIAQRKRIELLEVIDEVAQANAAKAAAVAGSQAVEEAQATNASPVDPILIPPASAPVAISAAKPVPPAGMVPAPVLAPVLVPVQAPVQAPVLAGSAPVAAVAPSAEASRPLIAANFAGSGADRRASSRHSVDTSAKLLLVKAGICMPSRILNLSLSGCRLRTEERFNVGIYVRLETEFYLHGLPFRLGGVSQAILDKHTIGIRFLDVSDRKRQQLTELMAEIAHAEAANAVADAQKAAVLAAQD